MSYDIRVQVPFLAPKWSKASVLLSYAGMAELADALDSGSSESNFMEVQVLLPAPNETGRLRPSGFIYSDFYSDR